TARFNVDAFPERNFEGNVRQIRLNSQVLQTVVTYNVVIDVNNPDEILLPGMTAFVNIAVADRRGVLRLPMAALRFRPAGPDQREPTTQGRQVYVKEGEHAVARSVKVGLSDGRHAEILGDTFREGDQVILEDLELAKSENKTQGGASTFRVRPF
ncbi:MAG: efflux transporter periplasmic adaptor subunit, partial [Proteobacteria bacterium]|nr:efflux transporter periplasmic adaptor subunit [Pseudomonadota bacterium]